MIHIVSNGAIKKRKRYFQLFASRFFVPQVFKLHSIQKNYASRNKKVKIYRQFAVHMGGGCFCLNFAFWGLIFMTLVHSFSTKCSTEKIYKIDLYCLKWCNNKKRKMYFSTGCKKCRFQLCILAMCLYRMASFSTCVSFL